MPPVLSIRHVSSYITQEILRRNPPLMIDRKGSSLIHKKSISINIFAYGWSQKYTWQYLPTVYSSDRKLHIAGQILSTNMTSPRTIQGPVGQNRYALWPSRPQNCPRAAKGVDYVYAHQISH